MTELKLSKKAKIRIALFVLILLAALIVSFTVFVTVPTGHTGVVVTWGKVENYVLSEGINIKLPWQKVIKMDNRTQRETLSLSAFSSDIQQVSVSCTVNFSVDKETSQNLYRNVGQYYYETVMQPRIFENVKSVFSKYSAESLVESRDTLSNQIKDKLEPEFKEYGIQIISVSIEDIDFTDIFTDAVEAKQVAEQSKLQAQIEQTQKTMEAEEAAKRQLIEAEAKAEVERIASDASAYSIKVQAEAEAEANKALSASLTELLIQYQELLQWNGELPQIVSGDAMLPIIDLVQNSKE